MESQKLKSPSSFWLRVKSLKQAASNVSSKVNYLSSAESSDEYSDESSVGDESAPNRYANESLNFQGISCINHEVKAREAKSWCFDSTNSTSILEDLSYFQKSLDKRNSYIKKLSKKYNKDINKLQAENERLREGLENTQSENVSLQEEIKSLKKEQAYQLQYMQANHERRFKKAKQEWDIIISQINAETAALVAETFNKQNRKEIKNLKDDYEQIIDQLRIEYDIELKRISTHNKDTLSLDHLMSPDKLYKPRETLEDSGPRCSVFKEGHITESIRNEFHDTISTMESKLLQQNEVIQQQDRIIDNLSKELQSAFKKKENRFRSIAANTSSEKVKELTLKEGNAIGLLNQINTCLDSTSATSINEALKNLKNRLESNIKLGNV